MEHMQTSKVMGVFTPPLVETNKDASLTCVGMAAGIFVATTMNSLSPGGTTPIALYLTGTVFLIIGTYFVYKHKKGEPK